MAGLVKDKVVKLASGSELTLRLAPFADSKALYQCVLAEINRIGIRTKDEVADLIKQIFCTAFSSPLIENAFWKCAERSLYNGHKIVPDSFEPKEAREDFVPICMEVGIENVAPFLKNLSAELERVSRMIGNILPSK